MKREVSAMATPRNVDTVQVTPTPKGSNKDMTVNFVCGDEHFAFQLSEYVASKLLEKLQGAGPRPVSPVTKLS